jgi:hypothetical protein
MGIRRYLRAAKFVAKKIEKGFRSRTRKFASRADYWLSPWNLILGRPRGVEHIWPPSNFSRRSSIIFGVFDRPLARRGVFLPRHNSPALGPQEFKTFHDEHIVISKILTALGKAPEDVFFVDIGAGDGIDMSNTYLLAAEGANGIAIEFNPSKFAMMATTYRDLPKIALAKIPAKPSNICGLLIGLEFSGSAEVLNLDIDSYDFFVLRELLREFSFDILCLEINPIFPWEVEFSVNFPSEEWSGGWFSGMSLSLLSGLLIDHGYGIVGVDRAAVFAVKAEAIIPGFPFIPEGLLQEKLDESLEGSSFGWVLGRFRNRPVDDVLEEFERAFSNQPRSSFLLRKSETSPQGAL